jgi:hypothetical protein
MEYDNGLWHQWFIRSRCWTISSNINKTLAKANVTKKKAFRNWTTKPNLQNIKYNTMTKKNKTQSLSL